MLLFKYGIYLTFSLLIAFLPAIFFRPKHKVNDVIHLFAHSRYNYVGLTLVMLSILYPFLSVSIKEGSSIQLEQLIALTILLPIVFIAILYYFTKNVRQR